MTFSLGLQSRSKLAGVHPDLVRVVERAITLSTVDFRAIEGVRTEARQRDLFAQGRTKPGPVVTWTLKSNHFINKRTGFGHAVDLLPAPYDWKELPPFDAMADAMFKAAKIEGVAIRWGADWDRDGNPRERGETDSPHFELDPLKYP
jgi:peptidoglycan L-alanyl-D-glutamate endopeptidase CwlK